MLFIILIFVKNISKIEKKSLMICLKRLFITFTGLKKMHKI